MSLYNAKCRAIRQTLILDEDNFDKLTEYLQKQGIEDLPYSQLAEHFIKNGDCGLDVDLEMPLRDAFAKYVDEHTTLPLKEIEDIIAEWCGEDFLMDCWDDIVDAHFGGIQFYDNVVFVVESEWDGRKWERTCETNLFSTYEKAKAFFDKAEKLIKRRNLCFSDSYINVLRSVNPLLAVSGTMQPFIWRT